MGQIKQKKQKKQKKTTTKNDNRSIHGANKTTKTNKTTTKNDGLYMGQIKQQKLKKNDSPMHRVKPHRKGVDTPELFQRGRHRAARTVSVGQRRHPGQLESG